MNAQVSLIRSRDRRQAAFQALDGIREDVESKLECEVLIKPNFLSDSIQLASSHADSVRGIVDFLVSSTRPPRKVVIAEGSAGSTAKAFKGSGFLDLQAEYGVEFEFKDLHTETQWEETTIFTKGETPTTVRMPKTITESPCTISLARAKTHDVCVVTLALKNMIMGTLRQEDRVLMHGFGSHVERQQPVEAKFLNINLVRLAQHLAPDISVVDGITGLQGNGPGGTDEIDLDVVAAGIDVFAVDTVMTYIMGFEPEAIGVLHYARKYDLGCTDLRDIEVLGISHEKVRTRFKAHESTPLQMQWQKQNSNELILA